MLFELKNYKTKEKKILPVLLLLDVSESMRGEKIQALNTSVQEMMKTFAQTSPEDVDIQVGIITFSSTAKLYQSFSSSQSTQPWVDLKASGNTALGMALTLGYSLLEDPTVLPKKIYRPAVVLVSDGQPNDDWEAPLQQFVTQGRSGKCQRFAIGIGSDVNLSMLEKLTGSPQLVYQAKDGVALKSYFQLVTQTVSQRSSQPQEEAPLSAGVYSISPVVAESQSISKPSTPVLSQSQDSHNESLEEEEAYDDYDEDYDEDEI